jgi:hypothetical protein
MNSIEDASFDEKGADKNLRKDSPPWFRTAD